MSGGRFICGVLALIWNPKQNKYLLLQRTSDRDFGAGEWECVTGRVEQGESFAQAALREIREELNAEARIELLLGLSHFYRGPALAENELQGVNFLCAVSDADAISLSAEHDAYRWVSAAEAETFLPDGHWLVPVIQRADTLLEHLPLELRSVYRSEGFDLS